MSDLPINTGISVNTLKPKSVDQGKKVIDDTQYIPKQYKDVAANMEQQFAEMMIDQMNKTVQSGNEEEDGDSGMDYYKSLQKSERAKMMTQQKSLGLQDMILNQIYPKRQRSEMALKQYEAQHDHIHHNLPSYKIDRKADTIEMGKNDSTSVSDEKISVGTKEDGGLR
jgi:Rod binding domain-containing protein